MVRHFCSTKESENECSINKQDKLDHQMEDEDLCKNGEASELCPSKIDSLPLEKIRSEDGTEICCDLITKADESMPLQDSNTDGMSKEQAQIFEETIPEIKTMFGTLLEQIWSGEWSSLRPTPFKDTLEIFHPQFRGAHQQDCQVWKRFKLQTRDFREIIKIHSHYFL